MHTWHATGTRKASLGQPGKSSGQLFDVVCTQIVDACFAGIIFVVPLLFGGRHALGRLVFVGLCCTAGVVWFCRQAYLQRAYWTRTGGYGLGLGAILLVTLQVVPLPATWLSQLAPRNCSLLLAQGGGAGIAADWGAWNTLSLSPGASKIALATLVAYVLLFVTAVQRLQTFADIQRLLRAVAIAAVVLSGFGLVQYFTSNGRFFWFYELPFASTDTGVKGSFSSRNHFAHFVALGVAPLLAWTVFALRGSSGAEKRRGSSDLSIVALHLGLLLVLFAILLSLSRGGAIAVGAAGTICIVFYYVRGMISGTYLYSLAALGLVVVGMLSLHGYGAVANRLDDLTVGTQEQLENLEGRRKIWAANLAALGEGGLFGAGAGAHREIYPVYLDESLTIEYTHADNGYLQIATETGYLGIVLLTLALATLARWCWQAIGGDSMRRSVLAVAVAASLVASAVHSLVDLVWYVPACMAITILLAACALRLTQLNASNVAQSEFRKPWTRARWIGLTTLASLASLWAVSVAMGPAAASIHWDKYLIASTAQRQHTARLLRLHESDAEDESRLRTLAETMIFHLRHVIARDPNSGRAHLRLAGKYLQLFDARQQYADNAMSIDQIRSAAEASHFESADQLRAWLKRAFGENSNLLYHAYHHTRRALELSPLQGEGYLYLANLCFLEGQGREAVDAYVAQSMRVRPHGGRVLFEAGRQYMLLGQSEKAIQLWQRIFPDKGIHQMQIVKLLAGRLPATLFVETFQPGWQTLPFVWQRYRRLGRPDDWQYLARYAAETAEQETLGGSPAQAAHIWRSLASMQGQLENLGDRLASLHRAYTVAPGNYAVRRELGQALLSAEQYRQAASHLRWCLARKPDDVNLRRELVQATKQDRTQTASLPSGNHRR